VFLNTFYPIFTTTSLSMQYHFQLTDEDGCSSVVEWLPSFCVALGLISTMEKQLLQMKKGQKLNTLPERMVPTSILPRIPPLQHIWSPLILEDSIQLFSSLKPPCSSSPHRQPSLLSPLQLVLTSLALLLTFPSWLCLSWGQECFVSHTYLIQSKHIVNA
jgi:hypothetical protein